jgi:hypothetical protein
LLWVVPPVLAVAFVVRGRRGLLGALRLGACAGALPAAQLLFRLAYYGDWVPNTARAKVALTDERMKTGAEYINGALAAALPLVAAGCVAFGVSLGDRTVRPRVLVLVFAVGAWLSYVRLIGGDIFPAYRHFTVLVPLVALAIGEGLRVLQGSQRKLAIVAALVALVAVFAYHRLERANPELKRASFERWEWDAEVVGPFLFRHFGERGALLAVEAAGALPYFAKLPALDLLGLNDRRLAHERPRDFGKGFIGHELGSGRYVREREPDLMVFQTPSGTREPAYKSGRDLVGTPWFSEEYELVRFDIVAPRKLEALVWVRRRGRAVAPSGAEASVRVPALLFGAGGERTVGEDSSGRLVVSAGPGAPARASGIEVQRGTYAVEPHVSGALSAVRVTGRGGTGLDSTGESFTCHEKRCLVDITLEPATGTTVVYGLELRRAALEPR